MIFKYIRVTEENKSPNLLTLCPFFGVAQKVTYAMGSAKLCRPFTRLEVAPYFKATPKSSAFWGIYFLPQP